MALENMVTIFGNRVLYDKKVWRPLSKGRPTGIPVVDVPTYGSHEPRVVVFHDTESHDYRGRRDIDGIAAYFRTTFYDGEAGKYTLGCHDIIDKEGLIGHIANARRITYHDGVNTGHIGIELIGFAWYDRRTWLTARKRQLRALSKITAYYCQKFDIPVKSGVRHGLATHKMVSDEFKMSDHYDPGQGFPFGKVIDAVDMIVEGKGWYNYYRDGRHVW